MNNREVFQYDQNGKFVKAWKSTTEAARSFDVDESTIRKASGRNGSSVGFFWSREKVSDFFESYAPLSLGYVLEKNDKLEYSLQKSRDNSRIMRAKNRTNYRFYHMIESFSAALEDQLEGISFLDPVPVPISSGEGKVYIVQLSDVHFNEEIDLPHNQYDFYVASRRLQKYATKVKRYAHDASKIIVALTGDMINSDRHLEEKTAMATNRMKASLLATSILSYFIQDLAQVAPVSVMAVSGNESRIHDEYGLTDQLLTDNYDFLIFNMLKAVLRGHRFISFMDTNPSEAVLEVNGKNILVTHGVMYKQATQDRIQKTFGRYASRGIKLDYIIFGHVHFANIGDIFARSGSVSGSNAYSEYGLDLVTNASQNLHIVYADGELDNIRMDIHNTDGYEGYPIKEDIDAYNAEGNKKFYKRYKVIVI